jgi:alpha-tubulin suppressor-like RCC1 family protein
VQVKPRRLVNSSRIQKIACGVGFNVGLTSDQKLLVWGQNYPGDFQIENLMTPKLLQVDFDAVDVSAGNTHCAAVDTNGKVYTWGKNGGTIGGGGQLGHGVYDELVTPKYVSPLLSISLSCRLVAALDGVQISSVSCGELHTIFFDRQNGQVWCCGANEYGRLGGGPDWGQLDTRVPQLLVDSFGGEKVIQVSAGFSHSIALTDSGRMFAWGRNDQGQLGLGDSFIDIYSMEDMPRLIESDKIANEKVVQVSAGKGVSAALTRDGKIFYWGHKVYFLYWAILTHYRSCTSPWRCRTILKRCPRDLSRSRSVGTPLKVELLFLG